MALLGLIFMWGDGRRQHSAEASLASPARPELQSAPAAAPPSRPPMTAFTNIARSEEGAPTLVSGPDPRSVLVAFCDAESYAAAVSPIGLAAANPPGAGMLWGVFQVTDDSGSRRRAVVIRLDPRTLQWSLGDGAGIRFVEDDQTTFPQDQAIAPVRFEHPDATS